MYTIFQLLVMCRIFLKFYFVLVGPKVFFRRDALKYVNQWSSLGNVRTEQLGNTK